MSEVYILANGAMASALAYGLRDKYRVYVVGRDKSKLKALEEQGFRTLLYGDFNPESKIIILAFKPYALESVAGLLKGEARILISVLANVDFEELGCIRAQNTARIMPNIAARYKASTTPFILKNSNFRDEILDLLNSFGKAYELSDASQMGAAMAISGCAPAFLAMVAQSITEGGICKNLPKNLSLNLTQGLFESFSALLKHEHPALIKENICSPGGVTIRGVKVLEERAIRAAFLEAINSSSQ